MHSISESLGPNERISNYWIYHISHIEFFLDHFGIGKRKEKKARGSKGQAEKGKIKHI